ncbi:hypothetical protein [Deinococcus sp.]|uniref:hypothetical protein n=1 Tax=Deinococcus sp. TaxID=47478 RepID=UPI003CC567C7
MKMKALKAVVISSSLIVASLSFDMAAAQQGQPATPSRQGQGGPGNFQLDPAQRARFQAMKPVFDLSSRVSLLPELEKNKATAVTGTQAKQLLPLLQKLQSVPSVSAADATKTLAQIEDKILTDAQVTALDDLDLKRQAERRAARLKAGGGASAQGGFRLPGIPGRVGAGGFGQGQTGAQGGPGSGTFNPFTRGRGADTLKAYIAVLQKK